MMSSNSSPAGRTRISAAVKGRSGGSSSDVTMYVEPQTRGASAVSTISPQAGPAEEARMNYLDIKIKTQCGRKLS